MPWAAQSVCSHAGCFELTTKGSCGHHEAKRQDNRASSSARGYGRRWRKLRILILHRDPICRICKRAPSTDVDHIIPKREGGEDSAQNLQGVCHSCHSHKTGRGQ